MIKTIANKQVVVGADFAGFELKEAVKNHLIARGWEVTDLTPVKAESGMYHRVGFALGSKIAEGEFERALAFCGTGMGIHVAASKVPHVHAAVAESVRAARRAAAANGCNLLAMGGFWIGHRLGMAMADAFLESHLGSGYEDWEGFLEYHQIGFNECEHFDYEAYKANGFQVVNPATAVLGSEPEGLAY
ncbi:RpiB/LacA/LacB family sugar-phosphate isomerase [Mobiluncus mulieris]|uniref:RpiB/LacA/LacB family sugar-phosphate isomerase n=1 Tax=Mobiluncus mulieris TaxID=2052 RepID=UPI00242F53AA|nr:RpiB/LacA/LacB family sugar-phosphate isomerase [Mobiluncus mulieris]